MTYRWRALEPQQEREVCRLIAAGVDRDAIAREYGVSRRTVDRTAVRRCERSELVIVHEWAAWFVITEDGPQQRTPWRAWTEAEA